MAATSGLKRNCIDKFYTKPEVAETCVSLFKSVIKVKKTDVIIEPSAGSGVFITPLRKISKNLVCYDIQPEHPSINTQDFLTLDVSPFREKSVHIVGNPPFGRQSSLARKFITKSCSFAQTVSFILPKSFKKESFMNTFPLEFHLVKAHDLPPCAFTLEGSPYPVPCVFQVWERKDYPREVNEVVVPSYYSYVKKDQNPSLSFRRVGVYAGALSESIEDKSAQSHYFLKMRPDIDVQEFIERYRQRVTFDFENTVGPKSISKRELDRKLQDLLN